MRAWMRVATAALVLVAGGALLQFVAHGEAVPLRRAFDELPRELGGYRGVDESLEPEVLNTRPRGARPCGFTRGTTRRSAPASSFIRRDSACRATAGAS